ncbi:phosphoribosyltransferase [Massilia sp. KIM]|uniref:phosphoribosyltransferase n=1 Tax=Massilia sp. KIM TaxID=1955422 RepID=UPI00098FADA4|nr:phosphoribosyltransferase [Massilia sp. KIM]OON62527.1 phosphoribosyltransferase [Massilia sp. KIM]
MKHADAYTDRAHAGRELARCLGHLEDAHPLVLALPRGGVPVAFPVARALHAELDLMIVRKLGLPGQEEFAMGAIGSGGVRVLQPGVPGLMGVSAAEVEAVTRREQAELARRERHYRGARPAPRLAGRCVILVDDGIATGASMEAAVEVARRQQPQRIVVAAPVGAPDTVEALRRKVDEVVCLVTPLRFRAVGEWYRQFDQTGDEEVQELLAQAWAGTPGGQPTKREERT